MKKEQENIELIEQYLEGRLSEEEKRNVEEHLKEDETFAGELKSYKFITDGIKYSGRKELLKNIKEWDLELSKEPEKDTSVVPLPRNRWYYVAASIIVFMTAAIIIYTNLNSGYERLVADYYKPYNFDSGIKRGENVEKSEIQTINHYFEQKDYDRVITMLMAIDEANRSEASEFMLANAYQAVGKYKEASDIYIKIAASGEMYTIPSKWYLALCYLSLDEADQAMPILRELQSLNSFYASKASDLLKELE